MQGLLVVLSGVAAHEELAAGNCDQIGLKESGGSFDCPVLRGHNQLSVAYGPGAETVIA
jgi:hypothetical protein